MVIRPSGTEAKLKCYLQLTAPVPEGADLAALRAAAAADLALLRAQVGSAVDLTG